jgi:hypothetical protein
MSRVTASAQLAITATYINLADNAPAHHRFIWSLFDQAYELVADRSFKPGVSTRDFQVGIADAGEQYTHQRFRARLGLINVADQEFLFIYLKSEHKQ